jgi:hypothetical protein
MAMFKRSGGLRRWGKSAGAVTAALVLIAVVLAAGFHLKLMPGQEIERKAQREEKA